MSCDTFLCYDTRTGETFATNVAESIERFGAHAFVAARPGDIPPTCENEREYRYDTLRNSRYVLLVATTGILKSPEVLSEIVEARAAGKGIVIFPDSQLDITQFEKIFPDLANAQRQPIWSDKCDLARKAVEWWNRENPQTEMPDTTTLPTNELIVQPKWSLDYVSNTQFVGKIVFDITNETDALVALHGYRMFRQNPDGTKDFYYNGILVGYDNYSLWAYSKIFRIYLLPKDRHVFNWGEVDIRETYGINSEGKWTTEVMVAYRKEGDNTLHISTGVTDIEYRSG